MNCDGTQIIVQTAKTTLTYTLPVGVTLAIEDTSITVSPISSEYNHMR